MLPGIYSPDVLLRSTTFHTSGKDGYASSSRQITIYQLVTQPSTALASFLPYN